MTAARSSSVTSRGTIGGRRAAGRSEPEGARERADEEPRRRAGARRRGVRRPRRGSATGASRWKSCQPSSSRRLRSRAGVAEAPVIEQPLAQRLLRVGPLLDRGPRRAGGRGQEGPALDEDELRRDGHERADVRQLLVVERRDARRGRRPRGRPGGTSRMSSCALLDEAEQERERPSKPSSSTCAARSGWASAASARSSRAPGRPRRTGHPPATDRGRRASRGTTSAGLVGESQGASRRRVDRLGLVADELGGPRRAACRQGERARTRRRGRAAGRRPCRRSGRRIVRPDARRHRSARRATRPRDAGGGRRGPFAQSWSRPARSRSGSSWPSARRCATTSRPWRWSARCIESNRASCAGAQPAAELVRSSSPTRPVTWRTRLADCVRPTSRPRSDPEQEALDRVEDRAR